MIKFIFKGIWRDRQRSVLPAIVVAIGVMLTVLFQSWLSGIFGESIEFNANFSTGHVKIMSRAYAADADQIPNDLALMGTDTLMQELRHNYPQFDWYQRIRFSGLIDVPDSLRETRVQGPAAGLGIDLLSGDTSEIVRMNISRALKRGRLPSHPGEILISDEFARNLRVNPGDTVTLITSTMNGSMSMYNFRIAGMVAFGTEAMDRSSIIADIGDVRNVLDMENASGEIVGFLKSGQYDEKIILPVVKQFNAEYSHANDQYSPVMESLRDQNNMATMLDYSAKIEFMLIAIFVLAMSLVLWNAGLLGGLRRYGEFGLRLALGEEKRHIYLSMIWESIFIGIIGSAAGTLIGLLLAWQLQRHGLNVGSMMKNAAMMMPSILRARISPETWIVGFLPGLISTVAGAMLSGIGIYKRRTTQLFKELEI